ncbi:hypothetical protein N7532_010195 [Penicillium argentinense]|uniref:Uncharacterized protein n=1 Tax=Penicillium argentinense TaxID=1131581 RepID=A0A9W9JXE7_9EURO|nr:uncharacterized protein N7532_010195 [Penicillium argentinense]KAJ5085424.1 hypothetical protein N7532_010195 [Penicillium argentinense]
MGSPDFDQDISPIPRSREENQERAFIAASRRKDRSLDARLESANRASMLHKKRTGKAFHITKEIVEKEAMYEEVDERYQEKRIRMLQAQNMQIEEQFHRHLLAAFAARANNGTGSAASSIHSRRASMAPRGSIDGSSSSRKMSLDLSNLRSPFPHGMESGSLASPMTASDGYVMSPSTNFDSSAQSYMTCMDGSDGTASSYSNMVASTAASASSQIPAYVTQPSAGAPPAQMPSAWQQVQPSWATMQQQIPTPNQTPNDNHAVHMWQQQMMQQATMPADPSLHIRQFRDRLASAPELPMHNGMPPVSVPSISGPGTGTGTGHTGLGHSRGSSQPSNRHSFHNLHLLTQGTHLAQMAPSSTSSPKIESLSAETQSTPDFCPTPNTPLSPTALAAVHTTVPTTKEDDGVMVSHEELDPDYNEFSQFALGLGGNSSLQERESFGFDEFVTIDEFGTVSC